MPAPAPARWLPAPSPAAPAATPGGCPSVTFPVVSPHGTVGPHSLAGRLASSSSSESPERFCLVTGNARSTLDLVTQYSSRIPVARYHAAKGAPVSQRSAPNPPRCPAASGPRRCGGFDPGHSADDDGAGADASPGHSAPSARLGVNPDVAARLPGSGRGSTNPKLGSAARTGSDAGVWQPVTPSRNRV